MSSNTDIHTNRHKQCQRQKINVRNIQNLYSMFMLSQGSNLGSITSINKAYNEVLLPWNKYICISNIRANPISIHYNIGPSVAYFFSVSVGVYAYFWLCGYDQIQTQLVTKFFFSKSWKMSWFPPVFPPVSFSSYYPVYILSESPLVLSVYLNCVYLCSFYPGIFP